MNHTSVATSITNEVSNLRRRALEIDCETARLAKEKLAINGIITKLLIAERAIFQSLSATDQMLLRKPVGWAMDGLNLSKIDETPYRVGGADGSPLSLIPIEEDLNREIKFAVEMGWDLGSSAVCVHHDIDGVIGCPHCGKTVKQFADEAHAYIEQFFGGDVRPSGSRPADHP